MQQAGLVVGANGALGTAIIKQLRSHGIHTIGTTRKGSNTIAEFTIFADDLCVDNCAVIKQKAQKISDENGWELTYVFLVAGIGFGDTNITPYQEKEMETVNVTMPKWFCTNMSDSQHILLSSSAVYGTVGTVPLTKYAQTKKIAEQECKAASSHITIVRLTQVETDFLKRSELKGLNYSPLIAISPEKAAKHILRGAFRGKKLILVGWATRLIHFAHKISPQLAQILLRA